MTPTGAAPSVSLQVLGAIEVTGAAGCFRPGRSRPGALLALLAMHHGEQVSSERVLDELWPGGAAPEGRDKRVPVNVVRLRRALAAVVAGEDPHGLVRTTPGGYTLALDGDRIDAVRFERGARRGRALLVAGDAAGAAGELGAALDLWRGTPYGGYERESFASADVGHLQELRLAALEDWAQAEIVLGEHPRTIAELERLVLQHPLRERLRALLMLALYRGRRQGDALAVYRATRTTLNEELGIEPCRELRELQQTILEQRPVPAPQFL